MVRAAASSAGVPRASATLPCRRRRKYDAPAAVPVDGDVKSAHDKLGSSDADLLAEANSVKNVTMMIATAPGRPSRSPRS
ncbi:hypothetical protein SHIRM173S_13364 [Streptomyces hirsutus]